MNPTRWAFIYHGILRSEKQQMDANQYTIARALGTATIPVRGKDGKLKIPEKFSEMHPLLFAVAQPHYMGTLLKSWEELEQQSTQDPLASIEISTAPIELDTDTGMEILDKPLSQAIMTEAERRQVHEAIGIRFDKPDIEEDLGEKPRPKEKPTAPRVSSFVLDD